MICSKNGTNKQIKRNAETFAEDQITAISGNRRGTQRYRVQLPLKYTVLQNGHASWIGTGTTIDISSSGMSFLPGENLEQGTFVQVVVDWPLAESSERPMELVVMGRVVRS